MIIKRLAPLCAALLALGCATVSSAQGAETTAFVNGHWWTGNAFRTGARYVRDGMFVSGPGAWGVDEVDLAGAYVLPAFAEAHHHRICDESVGRFLAAGIVYVGVMNARVSSRECQRQMYGPGGVEIVNALAGLTAHDAHPSQIGLYFLPADAIDGEWVHYVDSPADLDRVWARIEASPPDILKIFLGYSEDYERLRDDPSIAPWYRGLDPALAPEIVARAHARNLRVAVHVLSAHDFDIAVSAGADIVAHMPGFAPGPAFTPETPHPWLLSLLDQPERYLITRAAARAAARRGVAVITTLSGIEELPTPLPPGAAEYAALQRRVTGANVLMLRDAGVTLLIGSDRYDYSSVDEAQYLVRERLLSARQALRSLTYDTPRILFPQRNIGVLRAGGEASFVVLARNPLRDLAAIAHPTAVYKRGARVAAPQSAPQAER